MIAAPFLGEFGWEVALWSPWLRYCRRELYRQRDFTVMCKPGHGYLYEDFATDVVERKVDSITRVDCQLAWQNGAKITRAQFVAMAMQHRKVPNRDVITPHEMRFTWAGKGPPRPTKQARFNSYGQRSTDQRLIAFHARACLDKQPERNWHQEKWEDLVAELRDDASIASIGTRADALHIPGTEDMRGIPLRELCDLLGACRVVVGPSSGPLHLANHCGTPVAWWSANTKKDVERYEKAWNPFKVLNLFVAPSWDPDVDEVLVAVQT